VPRGRREGGEQQAAADIYAQPLKAYSQWLELQDGAAPAHEAARQYEEYKSTYMHKLAFGFFTTHKEDAWYQTPPPPRHTTSPTSPLTRWCVSCRVVCCVSCVVCRVVCQVP
jgi:hypothetical protein